MCEVLIPRFRYLPFDSVLDILACDDRFIIENGNIKDYYRISKTDPRYEMLKKHVYYKYFYYYYAHEYDNVFLVKTLTPDSNKYGILFCVTNNFVEFVQVMINDRTIENLPDEYNETTYDKKYKQLGDYILFTYIPRIFRDNGYRYYSLYYRRYVSHFMKRILYYNHDNGICTIYQSLYSTD